MDHFRVSLYCYEILPLLFAPKQHRHRLEPRLVLVDLYDLLQLLSDSYGPDDAVGDIRVGGCDDGCLCVFKHFDIDFVTLVSLVDPLNRVAAPKYINY